MEINSPELQTFVANYAHHENERPAQKALAERTEAEFGLVTCNLIIPTQATFVLTNQCGRPMMLKPALLFSLLFMYSCNSPEDRLGRLKHDFWEKFARKDFFEIKLKNDVLHLPLPPSSPSSEQQKALAESLYKEAISIDIEKLSAGSQKQLVQLRAAMSDCVAHHGNAFFDPSRCTFSGHLQQLSGNAELPLLLEQIPAYFAQIEQNWQIPDARFVTKAVNESQTTLDLLNGLEKNSGEALVAPARAAVKDFIGLCQSALLQ